MDINVVGSTYNWQRIITEVGHFDWQTFDETNRQGSKLPQCC